MNTVIISGMVLKRYVAVIQATGHLFTRFTLRNRNGVFVVVCYGDIARAALAADVGTEVVVSGCLRQRRPNGRTLWEIVVDSIVIARGEEKG